VRSARILPLRSEWPEDLRWALDLFLASEASEGLRAHYTPRFLFASKAQNKLLFTTYGTNGWTEYGRPWLDKNVGI
jgi:hypothetical protein